MVGPSSGERLPTAGSGGFYTALNFISEEILAGRYVSGSRLPAERALAAELGVSRGAVREAIKVLQAQGIISAAVGAGHGTRITTTQGPAFGRMLRLHLALRSTSFDDLTQTRVVLERAAAEAAATHPDETALETLAGLTAEMAGVDDTARFNELDTAFHVAIASMADNGLIRDMTIAIREAVAGLILNAEERLSDWAALRRRLIEEHEAIWRALAARDGPAAADLCEAHIRSTHQALRPGSEVS